METCLLTGWLKRLTGFVAAGFAVIVLAGPLLGILVTLTTFALVGFLLWLPLHTVFFGPCSAWRSTCEGSKRWRQHVAGGVRSSADCYHAFGMRVGQFAGWAWPRVKRVSVEAFCGAALGVLIVALTGAKEGAAVAAVATGLVAGGLLGIWGE